MLLGGQDNARSSRERVSEASLGELLQGRERRQERGRLSSVNEQACVNQGAQSSERKGREEQGAIELQTHQMVWLEGTLKII